MISTVSSASIPSRSGPSTSCPELNGTFFVNQPGLYPENVDFDPNSCLLYIRYDTGSIREAALHAHLLTRPSALFNATIGIHDPYKNTTDIVSFPDISRKYDHARTSWSKVTHKTDGNTDNPAYHMSGVAVNPYTNLTSLVVNAGAAFDTGGQNISGTNLLLLWDSAAKNELYRVNLTETTKGAYGGFQDVEFDKRGNIYVVGTFPSSILRVENNGTKVNEWFQSYGNHTVTGFQGLAAAGDVLLANDNARISNSSLVKFDMTASKGVPTAVPISPPRSIVGSDAICKLPSFDSSP